MATKDTAAKATDAAAANDGDTSVATDSSAAAATVTDTTPETPESLTDPQEKTPDTTPVAGKVEVTTSAEAMDQSRENRPHLPAEPLSDSADHGNGKPAARVRPLSDEELYAELDNDDPSLGDFIKKHYEAKDANIQQLARVLRIEITDVFDILKELGETFSQGV